MRILKFLLFFVVLFLLLCLLIGFLEGSFNTIQKDIKRTNIETYRVVCGVKRIFTGTVKFQYSSTLSFQEDGVLNYIPYTKGDFVRKGQIVAKIDDTLYKIKKNEETAALQELEIKYRQSKSFFDRMDILHKAGGVSDNDWEEAGYDTSSKAKSIALQKEKINYINKQLSYTILVSPFDGYVFQKHAETGEFITASKPVLTVVSSSKTQIEVMVSSDIVNKLNLGDDVFLKREDIFYSGKIAHISQSSSNSGGYLIKILLEKFYPDLKEGMNADVEFPRLDKDKIFIPSSAVVEENQKYFVYKLVNLKNNEGTVKKTEVKAGNIINGKTEVLYGLKKDDLIIIKGQENVRENSRIKI